MKNSMSNSQLLKCLVTVAQLQPQVASEYPASSMADLTSYRPPRRDQVAVTNDVQSSYPPCRNLWIQLTAGSSRYITLHLVRVDVPQAAASAALAQHQDPAASATLAVDGVGPVARGQRS